MPSPFIDQLPPREVLVVARLRLEVVAHLAAAAAGIDHSPAGAARRPFLLKLSCPGIPPAYVACRRGPDGNPSRLTAVSGGERPRGLVSLTLRFTSPRACAKALSGGGGMPIPIPRGPGAFAALRWFRAAAPRAAAALSDAAIPIAARARLAATAAVHGLAAAGSADPWLADRLAHVPDGTVALIAGGSFSLGIRKSGRHIEAFEEAPGHPSACLEFSSPEAALAVLSGRRAAVVALGAGEVSIRGLLPLVQGLFGVMDRLSDLLAVRVSAGGDR